MVRGDLRVAVLGGGRWGSRLVRTFNDLGALTAVADPSTAVRDQIAAEYPGVTLSADHQQALVDPVVDAVAIATPAHTHAALALDAIAAGKDVFVEKPFALTVADAERVVMAARENERVLMVGHLLLYQPAVVYLKELLVSGRIGWVGTLYQDRLKLGTVRTIENSLWSLGVHDVAAILYLIGREPIRTATWGQRILQPEVEDDMHLHMQFPDGAEAHIHNSWLWPEQRRRLTVIGTEAMVVYDETDQAVRLHRRRVNADLSVRDDGSEMLFQGDTEPLRYELEHFLECVRDRTMPRSSGESAIPVMRVLEHAAHQLRDLGGIRV